MSKTATKKPFVLPAHMVAVTIVPLVTEAYDKVRPRLVKWVADRQYKKFVTDVENFVKKHSHHR